jgi:heme exporter protein A
VEAPAAGGIVRLEVEALVKTFGATPALRGVDLAFEPGVTLLLGANGSGKTTLLRILATVLEPTSGVVRYEPIGESREQARGELGWVSHELLGYPDLSARENIELAARLQGVDPSAAWSSARERFSLEAIGGRPLRTFSRGQRQRVALARALVHQPSLLLLDEPATGLDGAGTEALTATLRERVAAGAVVVCVTHDPAALQGLATAEVTLERGRVARSGR